MNINSLVYRGAFRLPPTSSNGQWMEYSGRAMAYGNNSLFITNKNNYVAEVTIPQPVVSDDPKLLPFADYVQGFADPTNGTLKTSVAQDASITGLLIEDDGSLTINALSFYDANNRQRVGQMNRSSNLSSVFPNPWYSLGPVDQQGWYSGYMCKVPAQYRNDLGCKYLTGSMGVPIISRQSYGPSVYGFDSTTFTPFITYPSTNPLRPYDNTNEMWNGSSNGGGMVVVEDKVLIFGSHGIGEFGYGPGTRDITLHGTHPLNNNGTPILGETYCYDPTYPTDKGGHAWPYRYQIWAYNVSDLLDVKNGIKNPYDLIPEVWPISLSPLSTPRMYPLPIKIGDAVTDGNNRLFISELQADEAGYANRALIRVFDVTPDVVPEPIDPIIMRLNNLERRVSILEGRI